MTIEYLGHSSFLLSSDGGYTIVTDPYSPDVGFSMPKVKADLVTISHHHYDHDFAKAVKGAVVTDQGIYGKFGDFYVSSFEVSHDEVGGAKRGRCTVYTFSGDGVTLTHMADIGEPLSDDILEKIGHPDILILPVGGTYTVDAVEAKRYADAVKPHVIIPMHYKTSDSALDISGVDKFLSLYPKEKVAFVDGAYEAADAKKEDGQVVVLSRCV